MPLPRPLTLLLLAVLLQATLLATVATAQAVPVPGVFSTGVDANGVVIGVGVADPHYTMTGAAGLAVGITQHGAWAIPPSGSRWIGVTNGNVTAPAGFFTLTTTFDLTGFQSSTAELTGDVSADNLVSIYLNGVLVTSSCCWFGSLVPQSITTDFIPGVNTLELVVENIFTTTANPSGLVFGDVAVTAIPTVTPVLSVTNLVAGSQATLTVTGATPGSTVAYAYSLTGTGPTQVGSLLCPGGISISLSTPIVHIGSLQADAGGTAVHIQTVPVSAALLQVHLQALDFTSCTPTNVITAFIQ